MAVEQSPAAETAVTDQTPAVADATAAEEEQPEQADSEETTTEEPTAEEPTEVAAVTPSVPATPTVPATPAAPEEPTTNSLGIGDLAPPLAIDQWVKGEPIAELAPGQVYVVEFWATWCGPCRANMPHMSELQTDYGDEVQFVGVTREPLETVQHFLEQEQSEGKTWNEVIAYRLATDLDSTTNAAYMQAAGQNGIPCAFVVGRDGIVEWIGHPAAMEESLAKIVSGDWNRAAAIAELELREGLNSQVRAGSYDDALAQIEQFEAEFGATSTVTGYKVAILHMAGHAEEANALQAEIVEQSWDDPAKLIRIAGGIASGSAAGDLDLAQRAAERASELTNHEDVSILYTVAQVYHRLGETETATEWQEKAVEQAWDDARILNQIAWNAATGRAPGGLDLAQRAAERASELTNHEDASILDTVARVYHEQGELEKAIEWQKKALEHGNENPGLRATLEEYEAELPSGTDSTAEPADEGESTSDESGTDSEAGDE